MAELGGMDERRLLESLLALADRAELEVRILSGSASAADFAPTESAACRVGDRIWVVLAPDDPVRHQSEVLADALGRFRQDFLEQSFVTPAVRAFIQRDVD